MKKTTTLIKFYDKDTLKNIAAVLSLKPKKIVYLYDKGMTDLSGFRSLGKCFQRNLPGLKMDIYAVDILSVGEISRTAIRIIEKEGADGCSMELTGGSELMMVAGYKAATAMGIPLLYTDLVGHRILDLSIDQEVCPVSILTLEDFLDAKGACLMGESHQAPAPERYDAILKMAKFLFRHLSEWKTTCSFLQVVAASQPPQERRINSKETVTMKNGKKVSVDGRILREFEKNGFITGLVFADERVRFSFCSLEDKGYCINYGVWLELYVYVAAAKSGAFADVKLGTMIDWDAYDGVAIAGNEIDVILMENSLPIFISCKLRDADTATINELLVAKKRLGGWFSKGVIVTFSMEKRENTGTYKRAKELGLELLDAEDILAEDFADRLVDAIQGHDLVSLKWRSV